MFTQELTVDDKHDPLGDSRWDVVSGDAEVSTHLAVINVNKAEHFTAPAVHCEQTMTVYDSE